MSQADAAYYRRRAREERDRAKQATPAHAAAIHEELAQQYEALARREEVTASVASIQQLQPNGRPNV
jgi:hypothetical protein